MRNPSSVKGGEGKGRPVFNLGHGSTVEGALGKDSGIEVSEIVLPRTASKKTTSKKTVPPCHSRLIHGDNLEAATALLQEGYSGRVKMIYIDPPFFSDTSYYHRVTIKGPEETFTLKRPSYTDRFLKWDYLKMLRERLIPFKELLKKDGIIFLHCDWRMNCRIRLLLDCVFGEENFLNEIVWSYGGRGAKAQSRQFPRNHDTIYAYGRTKSARLKKLSTERELSVLEALNRGYRPDEAGRFFKTAPRGDYTDKSLDRLEKEGRIYRTRNRGVRVKYFFEKKGERVIERSVIGDVWDDIPDSMHSPLKERTDFGTQKPESLLKRLIESSTEKKDLVCDFFSGSGTTGVVAQRLGRRWVMCEKSRVGIDISRTRLLKEGDGCFSIEKTKTAERGNPFSLLARLALKGPAVREKDNGMVEITVAIKDYALRPAAAHRTKMQAEALKLLNGLGGDGKGRDFSLLIDYWAVDWDHNGRVFRSQWHSFRGNGRNAARVEKEARAVVRHRPERIAVRTVDVFGNEMERVFEI